MLPKIEKGVPVPERGNGWSWLARQMETGDSVEVKSRGQACALRNAIVLQGFKCTVRGVDGNHPRVWKLERIQHNGTEY